MPLELSWRDIAIRLTLSVLAGALIGANRERRRHPAGLRTTTLVSLAAAVAMIQANLLLPQTGKAADSFVVLDLMRLPLGILSGIGFIGAGAILKKGDSVQGVTTAATIWFVTVIGLCFGGGQLSLGCGRRRSRPSGALGIQMDRTPFQSRSPRHAHPHRRSREHLRRGSQCDPGCRRLLHRRVLHGMEQSPQQPEMDF